MQTTNTETAARRDQQNQLSLFTSKIDSWWQTQMVQNSTLKRGDLFARFKDLGSDSKFGKFLKGDFSDTETTLGEWLEDYKAVWNQIEDLGNTASTPEGLTVLDKLKGVVEARKAMVSLTKVNTTKRVLSITGESGLGKTCIVNWLRDRWGARIAVVEVLNIWHDKPGRLVKAICKAVGMRPGSLPVSASDCMDKLCEHLRQTRTAVAFEEAHHMGQQMINTVKSLLNETPGEFVFISIPTLLRRLQTSAYEEARQLFSSHRLFRTITLRLAVSDVSMMLSASLGDFPEMTEAAKWLSEASRAPRHGNLGFIRDVAEEVTDTRKRAGADGKVTLAEIMRAATAVIEQR